MVAPWFSYEVDQPVNISSSSYMGSKFKIPYPTLMKHLAFGKDRPHYPESS